MAAKGQLQFFCGCKNSKTWSQKLFKFYYHISHDFKVLLKFKIAARVRLFLGGGLGVVQNIKKIV